MKITKSNIKDTLFSGLESRFFIDKDRVGRIQTDLVIQESYIEISGRKSNYLQFITMEGKNRPITEVYAFGDSKPLIVASSSSDSLTNHRDTILGVLNDYYWQDAKKIRLSTRKSR